MTKITLKVNKNKDSYKICCNGVCVCKNLHKPIAEETFVRLKKMIGDTDDKEWAWRRNEIRCWYGS